MVQPARLALVLLGLPGLIAAASCTRPLKVGGQAADAGAQAGEDAGRPRSVGQLCARDSDCSDAFLACVPTTGTTCREASGDAGQGSPPWRYPDNLPICPETAVVTVDMCAPRYQQPCRADSDCGPAGFTCKHGGVFESACPGDDSGVVACGICNQQSEGPCSSDSECPMGWSCYEPCGCQGQPTYCYPPFAQFNCPACGGVTFGDGGAAPHD